MRVISGRLGGRTFNAPSGHKTHPMSEKIRGALFNMLGDIDDLEFLDAFAGSGAICFEAVSRGASNCVAIDSDKSSVHSMKTAARELGVKEVKIIKANASGWSDNNPDKKFDVVVCDPPYDKVQPELIQKMSGHCKIGGILVLSLPPRRLFKLDPKSFEMLSEKDYGDATLVFYRRTM